MESSVKNMFNLKISKIVLKNNINNQRFTISSSKVIIHNNINKEYIKKFWILLVIIPS